MAEQFKDFALIHETGCWMRWARPTHEKVLTPNQIMSRDQQTGGRPGWRRVRFGDVVRFVKEDADPDSGEFERYVAGEHIETDNLHIRNWGMIGDGYLGPAFHRRFRKGQVLYGSRRTYLRKIAVADFDGITANTTFVLEPTGEELLPALLPFIMQTEAFTHTRSSNRKARSIPTSTSRTSLGSSLPSRR